MPDDDAHARGADRARRVDELTRLQRQHRSANDAHEDRCVDHGDRDDHVRGVRPERGDDPEREEDRREGEEHVHHTTDRQIHDAAEIAGREAKNTARDRRARDRQHRDLHRKSRAEEDATEEVADREEADTEGDGGVERDEHEADERDRFAHDGRERAAAAKAGRAERATRGGFGDPGSHTAGPRRC